MKEQHSLWQLPIVESLRLLKTEEMPKQIYENCDVLNVYI